MTLRISLPAIAAASIALAAYAAAAASQSLPATKAEERYRACMAEIEASATTALAGAEDWRTHGGGFPARHCAAAATFALGRYGEAAEALAALARDETNADRLLRASLWAQAAQAWLSADEPAHAAAAATEALSLTPADATLMVLRAQASAAEGRWGNAIADLDRAIEIDARLVDTYVFRASARRQQASSGAIPPEVLADLDRALARDPRHPEALLERGIVRRAMGDDSGARTDWQVLIDAAPKTPAAEQARLNLERLEKGG